MSTVDRDRTSIVPFAAIRTWMFNEALPLWGSAGVDRRDGGFVEQLHFNAEEVNLDFKRTRVTCRQIYVFSHAAVLGWEPGRALAEHGVAFLRKSWQGPQGGWPRTVTRNGEVKDPTADLYDIAFVMFALGWYVRATNDQKAVSMARETLQFVDVNLRHPGGEGFLHEKPSAGWRLQNPHMHLLEAMLACYEATGDEQYGAWAVALHSLFRRRLFDPKSRTLAEYFNEDWTRAPGEVGRLIEPGHQFEWAWILANLKRLTGEDTGDLVRDLADFAETFGVDRLSGATYNQVRDDGAPIDRGSRTWPNTERIKGHIALQAMFGVDSSPAIAQSARLLLDRYLAVEKGGLWIDLFDAHGAPQSRTAPASTFYHVFLAFAEVLQRDPARGAPHVDNGSNRRQ